MMVNDRISKSPVLVPHELKPAWEVATRGRRTLLVVNFNRVMHHSSVARLIHVVIGYRYSQVVVRDGDYIPSKCRRALFFNL